MQVLEVTVSFINIDFPQLGELARSVQILTKELHQEKSRVAALQARLVRSKETLTHVIFTQGGANTTPDPQLPLNLEAHLVLIHANFGRQYASVANNAVQAAKLATLKASKKTEQSQQIANEACRRFEKESKEKIRVRSRRVRLYQKFRSGIA
eukprot:Blabericola_migrator_1__3932@NODE_218_length_11243_cov_184_152827_g185_i0_p7_GENE_NODE_218_length_11243_cov_184_152827_g185_i0NODE_218_length_11243_cov_184_152827_g185_i0_p7_ORF_typecomplete_len153_score15_01WEMBL/PF05701_11/1_8WEMBL/PF05701_11/2_7DUF4769/PF15992_5/6_3e03DUF4769/PF15992_5/0_036Phage_HK97_TLTM/PF06120_11/0_074BcrAbl_Oligo/PF09036_10/0_21BcrAbl_Oligo/PF09036_10/1_2e03_NODE_218_length_11243_cov_184_152827_g185_i036114069